MVPGHKIISRRDVIEKMLAHRQALAASAVSSLVLGYMFLGDKIERMVSGEMNPA